VGSYDVFKDFNVTNTVDILVNKTNCLYFI